MHVLSDPIADSAFPLQPPCANAACVNDACKTTEIKKWRASKLQKDPATGKGLPICEPCYHSEVRIHPTSIHSHHISRL